MNQYEEDLERDFLKDAMYLGERERDLEEEWWRWEDSHRKPEAEIIVIKPKEHETFNYTLSFFGDPEEGLFP